MKFGLFMAPHHATDEDPTLAFDRDLELVQWLDALGYDEAYVGEHHSAGWETISSPEVFIATAAERTRHIRLGTGVVSLPYHHPFIVADRMVLLDHLTKGRVIFGVGPGGLISDALMMGIDPKRQREMMDEALGLFSACSERPSLSPIRATGFSSTRQCCRSGPIRSLICQLQWRRFTLPLGYKWQANTV